MLNFPLEPLKKPMTPPYPHLTFPCLVFAYKGQYIQSVNSTQVYLNVWCSAVMCIRHSGSLYPAPFSKSVIQCSRVDNNSEGVRLRTRHWNLINFTGFSDNLSAG